MSGDVDFREKYAWWNSANGRTYNYPPELIEREYAEAHPPRLTAEDVWTDAILRAGHNPATYRGADDVAPPVRWLCQHVADLRNAAREDDDEEWVEKAAQECYQRHVTNNTTWLGTCNIAEIIRAAYRARRQK